MGGPLTTHRPPAEKLKMTGLCHADRTVSCPGRESILPARSTDLGKTPANAQQKRIADLAISGKFLLPAAVDGGRVVGRPIFDISRKRPRQLQRLVVRLRRQRDDQVEIEPFPILQLLE